MKGRRVLFVGRVREAQSFANAPLPAGTRVRVVEPNQSEAAEMRADFGRTGRRWWLVDWCGMVRHVPRSALEDVGGGDASDSNEAPASRGPALAASRARTVADACRRAAEACSGHVGDLPHRRIGK